MRRLGWAVCWQPRPSIAACRLGLEAQCRLGWQQKIGGRALALLGEVSGPSRCGESVPSTGGTRRIMGLSWGYHGARVDGTRGDGTKGYPAAARCEGRRQTESSEFRAHQTHLHGLVRLGVLVVLLERHDGSSHQEMQDSILRERILLVHTADA